jgi:L-cysteine desulfidase
MSQHEDRYLELLKREVVPALGCTDPIAIALAASKARSVLPRDPDRIDIILSRNMLKNAMAVGIPGAGDSGVELAAALGSFAGEHDAGLRVLKALGDTGVQRARQFVNERRVGVRLQENSSEPLYIEVVMAAGADMSRAIIRGDYARVTLIELNGIPSFKLEQPAHAADGHDAAEPAALTIRDILEFAAGVPLDRILFMLDAAAMNQALSAEGLSNEYGLSVGRLMRAAAETGLLGDSLATRATVATAAAVDARMSGCFLPAMTNSGSGNQGITATMPVVVTASERHASDEQLARALVVSHLVSIHMRQHFDRLSPMCGTIPAATGAACGVLHILGGGYEQAVAAIANMAGNLSGMICDGAKPGCALKASSAVQAAFASAVLAKQNVRVSGSEGIVDTDVENIIDNLGHLGSEGMRQTDAMILDTMLSK